MLEDRDRSNNWDNVDEVAAIIREVGWFESVGYLLFVEQSTYNDPKLRRVLEGIREECRRADRRCFGDELVWKEERRRGRDGLHGMQDDSDE